MLTEGRLALVHDVAVALLAGAVSAAALWWLAPLWLNPHRR